MSTPVTIKPQSIASVIDRGVALFRRNFWLFFKNGPAYLLALMVISVFSWWERGYLIPRSHLSPLGGDLLVPLLLHGSVMPRQEVSALWLLGRGVSYVSVITVLAPAMIRLTIKRYLGTLPATTRYGSGRFLLLLVPIVVLLLPLLALAGLLREKLIGTTHVLAQIWLVEPISVTTLIAVLEVGLPQIGLVALLATLLLPGLFAAQAIVLEGCGIAASLRRSWTLTRRHLGRLAGIMLAVAVLLGLIMSLPEMLIALVPLVTQQVALISATHPIAEMLTELLEIALLPLPFIVATIAYYDLRVRVEGYDLEENLVQASAAEVQHLYTQGSAQRRAGDLSGAMQTFGQALDRNPRHHGIRLARMWTRMLAGDLDGALDEVEQTIALFPRSGEAFANRAYLQQQRGNQGQAAADYRHAVQLQPELVEKFDQCATQLYYQGDLHAACILLEMLLQLAPTHDRAHYNLACVYACLGQAEQVLKHLRQATELDPQWRTAARTDSDFDALRGDPGFNELVAAAPERVSS